MSSPETIIVSGASRGLGLAMVRRLLQRGSSVAAFSRRETADVDSLRDTYGASFHFETLDAVDQPRVDQFLEAAIRTLGPIRALVNNAALGQDQLLVHLPVESVGSLLATNIRAPILLTRSVVRHLLLTGCAGRIVNITSICGSRGYAGLSVYSATKGAMEAFTRSLAHELGPRGILVNAIAPGFFRSEMSHVLSPDQVETIRRRTPTERMVTAEDILPVLELLLFADGNMTGQVLTVDGGISV